MKTISKEDIQDQVGIASAPSEWFTVTQAQIDQFADCTLDNQYIHTDPEKAKGTQFGSTIAHGFLSLSMLSYFSLSFANIIDGTYMGINYGFDKIRFLTPVKVDSRIRAQAKVLDITEKHPGQFVTKTEVNIEIEGEDKPALVALWITVQMVA